MGAGAAAPRRVLYLLRHAKSSWDAPELADHDRPLAPRGVRAAGRIAGHLSAGGVRPALVLCSSSRRTLETLDLIAPALGAPEVLVEPGIYGADEDDLLLRLRRVDAAVASVMVIGHAPGLPDLALSLAGGGDAAALAALHAKMPTGALATLALRGDWSGLERAGAELTAFVVPRELK
jgi:phosphohistidine phosphatase